MSAKVLLALLAAALPQILPFSVPLHKPHNVEQARAPIERMGPVWAEACKGHEDDWNEPAPPVRIQGNTYYVGTCGISSILVTGSAGHVLIDAGTEKGAELIADNIRALGFKVQDVRFILTSHEHFDHVGGVAKLMRMSGAILATSAAAARVLSTGKPGADDPQAGSIEGFEPVITDRIVTDGYEIRLGDLMLQAIATPGHTRGALSWRWVSCDGGVCRTIVYADSLTPVSNNAYRFSDHPEVVAAFRKSIAKIAASPCDIIITPHPSASHLLERFAAGKPLLDEEGCRAYAESRTKLLDERLAKEAAVK